MKTMFKIATGLLAVSMLPAAAMASSTIAVQDATINKTVEWSGVSGYQYTPSSSLGTTSIDKTNSHISATALGSPYPLASVQASTDEPGSGVMGSTRITYHYAIAASDTTKANALAAYLDMPVVLVTSGGPQTGLQGSVYYVPNNLIINSYNPGEVIPLSKAAAIISGFYGLGYSDGGFSRLSVDAGSSISSLSRECSAYAGPCGTGSYSIFGQLTRDPNNSLNFLGTVNLFVEAGANDKGTAFASVDPMATLNIDFGFDPNDFGILLSQGFTNATEQGASGAVPEPGSWALMTLGLAIAGSAMRRQRRMQVSFA